MQKKAIMVAFLVASMLIGTLPNMIIRVGEAAPTNRVNDAITRGLIYLNSHQATDGSWGGNSFHVADTAMAVLAFENFGHLPGNLSDPYHITVEKGLNYLFGQAYAQPIGAQPAGNPDKNSNGIGIQFGSYTGYETPMALMAIVASRNKSRIATAGPTGVINRNYSDIVQDIVDWIAWAQTDPGNVYEGGWRYTANYGSSDMSVTQWPILGLMTAELWNINAPDWVKTELAKWLAADQILTGNPTSNYVYGCFMYEPYNQLYDIVDTAAGIAGLTYCGANTSDPRIIAAEGYITRDWYTSSGWRANFGDLYAMYGIMKTMRLTRPTATKYIVGYNDVPAIEWYNGTGQYADYLVNNQQPDGHWIGTTNPEEAETGANLDTAFGTLILEGIPVVVKYTLTVRVIDPDIISPVSEATVLAVGPENRSGITGADGVVVFNKTQAGPYVVSASKAGYIAVGETMYLAEDTNITMELAQAGPFKLNVSVVNSCSLPISNALVEAANITAYSNASGIASFELPRGSYNVTASNPDYQPASSMVDLHGNKNITLTLAYPYVFLGGIPDSKIVLQPVESGYNITLLNSLVGSGMDVFFDWEHVGTIPAGSWQSFNFNHLPNLIVEAALKGSVDYPHAWNKHPLPIQLPPTTGQEGAFLPEPVPYAAGSIFVIPYPPVYGQNTTIGVTLHNPFNHALNISRIDFQVSGLTIGGYFTSVGYLSNVTLQANETNSFGIAWLATVGGHHCVRVVLTYSPESQTMQRNMEFEYDVLQGQTGEAHFTLANPYQTTKTITLKVNQQLPPGWQTELEINGLKYSTSSDITRNLAAGEQLPVIIRIESSSANPGQAVFDVQGYIDGQPIGGVRKTMQTVPITYPQYLGYYLASYPDGTYIPGQTANFGEPYEIVVEIKNPDVVSHTYTIDLAQNGVSTPIGAIAWNWPDWLKPIMEIVGVPTRWDADPEWAGTVSVTENVAPGQTANFIFTASSKWHWIPPWDWKYLLSTILWISKGLSIPIAIGDIISWTQPLGFLDQLQGIGSFIRNEQFSFQVSFGSTVLGTGGASVTMPYSSEKVQDYAASLIASFPTGALTFAAIDAAATGLGAPLAVALALDEAAMIALQNYCYQTAADPSSDYTQVVQPMPLTLLNGTKVMELPAVGSLTGTTYNVFQTLVGVLEYQNATTISIERYGGARDAGDQYYQNLQLQALTTYASHRDLLLALLENQLSILSPLLPPLNSSAIRNAETYLSQNGLPGVEQQLLTGLGLSSSIPAITTAMQVLLNATLLHETLLSQFSLMNGVQAVQSLLVAETDSWEQLLSPGLRHDVAVTSVTPYGNWTYQGWTMNVNVTTTNLGDFTENETLNLSYYNTVGGGTIGTKTVVLAPNQTQTVVFTWDATGAETSYSGYTITAVADISPLVDSNSTNNVLGSSFEVKVRIPGDINGDGKVDLKDAYIVAKAFGECEGRPRWNPLADLNEDGKADLKDYYIVSKNYGKSW